MRLLVALLGPALLAFVLMESASWMITRPAEQRTEQSLVWAGRVFTSEGDFARWLAARGQSYDRWRELHPGSPWNAEPPPRPAAMPAERSSDGAGVVLFLVLALGAAVLAFFVLVRSETRRALGGAVRNVRVAKADRRLLAVLTAPAAVALAFAADVRRGARVLWAVLATGVPPTWRAFRTAVATGVPPTKREFRKSVETVRVGAPAAARAVHRGVVEAVEAADDLYGQVQRDIPVVRTVIGYGAISVASGAFGVAIAIVLR